jgi:probable HAF family extracellular repeat protein
MTIGLAIMAAPASAQCPASDVRYSIVDLGTLGGTFSVAGDINDAGRVVGASWTATGDQHPFLWEDGVMTDIGPGLSFSQASGINAGGEITGQFQSGVGGPQRAFFWASGVMTELPTLSGFDGRGFDINDLGQVVGISTALSGYQHGFLYDWDTNTIADLGTADPSHNTSYANGINESGQIAAWSGPMAYLYENGVWTALGNLGGGRSVAFGLDDLGRVVGWSHLDASAQDYHPFLWASGVMTDLGTLGGRNGIAWAAHASGPVVGYADTSDGRLHAFLYSGDEMADLNALIPADTGWELDFATAINASGQIVGRGVIGGENHAYLASPATVAVDDLSDLVESFGLPDGVENSLVVKLNDVRTALEGCDPSGACAPLGAFINQVNAQYGKALTAAQADALLAAAAELQTTLGCP